MTIAGHTVSLGGTQAVACGDLSNGATGCSTAVGTSGAMLPLLSTANNWTTTQTMSAAPILATLTGYVYCNGASPCAAATTVPVSSVVNSATPLLAATNTWTSAQTFSAAPIFSSLTGYVYCNGASPCTAASTVPFTSLSGSATAAQLPAFTGGDCTSAAGSTVLTCYYKAPGASTVTQSTDAKLSERLSMEDLGALANGVNDDGATVSAALLARYGALSSAQIPYAVVVEGTPDKTYRILSPITLAQQHIRLIGRGATLSCATGGPAPLSSRIAAMGAGGTPGTYTLPITATGGASAAATFTVGVGGSVNVVDWTNAGSGYTAGATISNAQLVSAGATGLTGASIVLNPGGVAVDVTQGNSGNPNLRGEITGWRITGCASTGIRTSNASFYTIADNEIANGGDGVRLNGVTTTVRDNYIHNNTGDGILLHPSNNYGGGVGETQRAIVERNRIYNGGGVGIRAVNGIGHFIAANDTEANAGGEVYFQSSLSNFLNGHYAEPVSDPFVVRLDNTASMVAGRYSDGNQIIGGLFGGSATTDIDIAAGNSTFVTGVHFGSGAVNIAAGSTFTVLGPQTSLPTVTNASPYTMDMSSPGKITGYGLISSTSTPVKNGPGFVDFGAADTTKTITFGTAEADAAYQVDLTAVTLGGTPAAGSKRVSLNAFPTTAGFIIANEAAPGASNTVRVWYRVYR